MRDKERLELLENGSAFSSDDITFLLKQARLYQISRDDTRKACHKVRVENKELEQQNKRYREALDFYSNGLNYTWQEVLSPASSSVMVDGGLKARQALEQSE